MFNIDVAILGDGQTEREAGRGNQDIVTFFTESGDGAVEGTGATECKEDVVGIDRMVGMRIPVNHD